MFVSPTSPPNLTCMLQQPGIDPHRHHHHGDHLQSKTMGGHHGSRLPSPWSQGWKWALTIRPAASVSPCYPIRSWLGRGHRAVVCRKQKASSKMGSETWKHPSKKSPPPKKPQNYKNNY